MICWRSQSLGAKFESAIGGDGIFFKLLLASGEELLLAWDKNGLELNKPSLPQDNDDQADDDEN